MFSQTKRMTQLKAVLHQHIGKSIISTLIWALPLGVGRIEYAPTTLGAASLRASLFAPCYAPPAIAGALRAASA